jgi:hypothetical protein
MAREYEPGSPEAYVSEAQSASIEIMNARMSRRDPLVFSAPTIDDIQRVNAELRLGPRVTTRRERDTVSSAMREHMHVANGTLPRKPEPIRFLEKRTLLKNFRPAPVLEEIKSESVAAE